MQERDISMRRALSLAGGVGIGAGIMFFLDPQMGRRRRALMRDQFVSASSRINHGLDLVARDARQRARGAACEARARLNPEPVDDRVLVERVRSKLGRVASHPAAIKVTANQGCITIEGPILADEVDLAILCVAAVPGVIQLDSRLDPQRQPDRHTGFQRDARRPGPRPDILQRNWSPTTRLLIALAGAAMFAYGFRLRAPWACVVGSAGLGIAAEGISNREIHAKVSEVVEQVEERLGLDGHHRHDGRRTLAPAAMGRR